MKKFAHNNYVLIPWQIEQKVMTREINLKFCIIIVAIICKIEGTDIKSIYLFLVLLRFEFRALCLIGRHYYLTK
jgi:hypothetical protein